MSIAMIRKLALPMLVLAVVGFAQVVIGYMIINSHTPADTNFLMALCAINLLFAIVDLNHIFKTVSVEQPALPTPARRTKQPLRQNLQAVPLNTNSPTRRFRQRVQAERRTLQPR